MNTSFWSHCQGLVRRMQTSGAGSGQRVRRSALGGVEGLEARTLLSSTPAMVADIAPGAASGNPVNLTAIGSTTYFVANDGMHGEELWKSDGTAAGTAMVKDLNPGAASSYPGDLTNVNGTLFFTASDGRGVELWKSDGTASGTAMVPGAGSDPGNLTNVSGTLFFSATDANGTELWKSDGTVAGTMMVKDIAPGGATGYYGGYYPNSSNPANLTDVNGTLFFTATINNGIELWKSDGTSAGTQFVGADFSNPGELTNVNGTLFFTAYDGTHGDELWKSDGTTAGTTLVKDIAPGGSWVTSGSYYYGYSTTYVANSSSPRNLTNANGTLFFTANDGTDGEELWKSDGTDAGTVMVADIRSGSATSYPSDLTNVNGTLFFAASGRTGEFELWKSDGTAAGTVMLSGFAAPAWITDVNGTVYFAGNDGTHGDELWKSDGTAAGTTMVADIDPGSASSSPNLLTDAGTVQFKSSDTKAVLPANYTFAAADAGKHTFSVTLKTAGTQSISAADTALSALGASEGGILVNAGTASQFLIAAPSGVTAGSAFNLTLTVEDAYGNVVTGYVGTVHFTSTDRRATLPANYTFTSGDKGVHTFTGLVLRSKGKQTITITDTMNKTLTASVIENVVTAAPPHHSQSHFHLLGGALGELFDTTQGAGRMNMSFWNPRQGLMAGARRGIGR